MKKIALVLLLVGAMVWPAAALQAPDATARETFLATRSGVARKRSPALGYTLFRRHSYGPPNRVDPAQPPRKGDALRLVFEPGADGYLYVFETEGEATKMVFPDWRRREGENRVSAHSLVEVPSREALDPRAQWFWYTAAPTSKRITAVLSRKPLEGVPTGAALIEYGQQQEGSGEWVPTPKLWRQIVKEVARPAAEHRLLDHTGAMTDAEKAAIEAGSVLAADAPEPSVVRVAPKGDRVLAEIDLSKP